MEKDLIKQCCRCRDVRIHYHGNGGGNKEYGFTEPESDEELHFFHRLELLAAKIIKLNLGSEELKKQNIFVSTGLCKLCARDLAAPSSRAKQRRENHFDCFGKAIESCDQKNCKYYKMCVVPKEELQSWEKRIKQSNLKGRLAHA